MADDVRRWRGLRRFGLAALGLGLVFGLAARGRVVVDETEYVLVTEFGRPVVLLGDDPGEAGLHWKWPWQEAIAVDRRLRVFDPPPREVITGDKRNLEVAGYVAWRVADPQAFLKGAATPEAAEARLSERVAAALSDSIGTRPLAALASTDAATWALDALTTEVREAVAGPARRELGVEVVDIRLRRFNHPVEVRPAVFDLIRSERRQVAATLRAEGESAYQALTSQADRERDAILARAEAEAERIRGRGEAEATRILNEAHGRDPQFYAFLRTLETYRAILDDKATVVLSSSSPLLKLLREGPPGEPTPAESPPASPGTRAEAGRPAPGAATTAAEVGP